MIKTVLVHLRGTKGDAPTLAAALQIARPFAAHLECLHIRPDLAALLSRVRPAILEGEADAIARAMTVVQEEGARSAERASHTFAQFCTAEDIQLRELPPAPTQLSASFREDIGDELERLVAHTRRHDMAVVKGGNEQEGGLGLSGVGRLVLSAGRPVLLAPTISARAIRSAVVAWKDTPEASRAIGAAMPILERAGQIFVVTAAEDDDPPSDPEGVVSLLQWHGLKAEAHRIEPRGRDAHDAVLETARAADADLLVAGAYGHNRLREVVFGGFTEGLLEDASIPVLLLH